MGYKSTLVPRANLGSLIGSSEYFGGLIWHDTFGINAYQYVQEMKLVLLKRGVQVLEQTPVLQVKDHEVVTPKNTYTADVIIVCVDRFLPQLHMFAADIYQAQTFIALSKPLPDSVIKQLFPERQLMVWDTDLIYTYFRLVDGNRLLVGGSNYLSIFWGSEQPRNMRVRSQLSRYISRKFPYIDFQL